MQNSTRWIKEEFQRITTIHLERNFLTKLDFYTPKLQEIFGTKGGVAGTKIRPLLDSLSQLHVEDRRDAIIRCLMEFLGESTEELIKDYQDVSKEFVREDYAEHVMKIVVLRGSAAHEGPADVSIIIEGMWSGTITSSFWVQSRGTDESPSGDQSASSGPVRGQLGPLSPDHPGGPGRREDTTNKSGGPGTCGEDRDPVGEDQNPVVEDKNPVVGTMDEL
nr:uncharacterized protein LOC117467459 [Pseudochaenichthys georgianus]